MSLSPLVLDIYEGVPFAEFPSEFLEEDASQDEMEDWFGTQTSLVKKGIIRTYFYKLSNDLQYGLFLHFQALEEEGRTFGTSWSSFIGGRFNSRRLRFSLPITWKVPARKELLDDDECI